MCPPQRVSLFLGEYGESTHVWVICSVLWGNPHLEYECQVVGVFLCVPRRLGTGHLDDGTAHTPHVTAPAILLPSQHLQQNSTPYRKVTKLNYHLPYIQAMDMASFLSTDLCLHFSGLDMAWGLHPKSKPSLFPKKETHKAYAVSTEGVGLLRKPGLCFHCKCIAGRKLL